MPTIRRNSQDPNCERRADAAARDQEGVAIAYVCSRYPAVSHTFVMREIAALRRLGARVETFTVRRTQPHELLSANDRSENASTCPLVPASPYRIARALLSELGRPGGPARFARAMRTAWELRRPGLRGAVWQVLYLIEAVILTDSCRRKGVRHIHAHFANVASDVALLSAGLGSEQDNPWSWSFTMHGPADLWNVELAKLRPKAECAAFVACISHFARSQLMALTSPSVWPRLEVIRCGLEFASEDSTAPPVAPSSGEFRILNVGRLSPVKGQLLLLDLARALIAEGLEFTITVVGDGPERASLTRAIAAHGLQQHVRLLGAVGQEDVARLFAQAHLFALPSFAEGVPVVAMEAMAAGVPVVATRVAGLPELIEDKVSGRLVTPGSTEDFIDAVTDLIRDGETKERYRQAAYATVSSKFDVDQEARRLLTLFRTVPGCQMSPTAVA